MSNTVSPFLSIKDLRVWIAGTQLVRGVNIDVSQGQTLGIVGESGCGKSLTWLATLGLLGPQARIAGSVLLDGEELLGAPEARMNKIRGGRIGMVFQDAQGALNPVRTIGWQIAEPLRLHRRLQGDALRAETLRLLDMVEMPSPQTRINAYPHELSGGQNQRVMLAMALAGEPELLVADEPTTALDATIQAQIIDTLLNIQRDTGMAMIVVSHDLSVVSEVCDMVSVMYAGRIIEQGPTASVFSAPAHPYTAGLLTAFPTLDGSPERLYAIRGTVPNPDEMPLGCAFAPRCDKMEGVCAWPQRLEPFGPDHEVACILAEFAA